MAVRNSEQAVRSAAAALKAAIEAAKEDGLSVHWPSNVDGLDGIAVSETRKAKPQPVPAYRDQPADAAAEPKAEGEVKSAKSKG